VVRPQEVNLERGDLATRVAGARRGSRKKKRRKSSPHYCPGRTRTKKKKQNQSQNRGGATRGQDLREGSTSHLLTRQRNNHSANQRGNRGSVGRSKSPLSYQRVRPAQGKGQKRRERDTTKGWVGFPGLLTTGQKNHEVVPPSWSGQATIFNFKTHETGKRGGACNFIEERRGIRSIWKTRLVNRT